MIKPHTSTIIFVSHFLFIEKSETANKRRQRQYDMWESVTTGPEHITRNTKWQKKHRGVLLKIFMSMLIIGFECNFTQSQTVSLNSIFSMLFKGK